MAWECPCAPARRPALEHRGPPVDGELGFPIEDDEHLLALVVEVGADAALRLDDAAVQEEQVGVERRVIEQGRVVELAGPAVHRRARPVFRRVGVHDALRQRPRLCILSHEGRHDPRTDYQRDDRKSSHGLLLEMSARASNARTDNSPRTPGQSGLTVTAARLGAATLSGLRSARPKPSNWTTITSPSISVRPAPKLRLSAP